MEFFENITMRMRPRAKSFSNEKIEDCDSDSKNSTLDGTTSSLPNISNENDEQILMLKTEIENLRTQLNAAHDEISKLSLENMELKQIANDINSKYEIMKKATTKLTSELVSTPRKTLKNTPHKKNQNTKKSKCSIDFSSTPMSSKQTNISPTKHIETKPKEKHKICIISSNKNNKMLSLAEEHFYDYKLCHYLTPNCRIEKLLDNIHSRLIEYTQEDFCFVFIGEEDFRRTNNYYNIIVRIRETLSSICHTNVILCLPTYKDNCVIFNWRVETFNNMLYLDNQTHNYVTILDSNLSLAYDHSMFSIRTGRLNNNGMRNIYLNLKMLVDEYLHDFNAQNKINDDSYNSETSTTENSELFRV